ncbi:MAG TPA: TadE family protein [Magnetospirillum sp.]|jgi:Flp pilus assembly protein TadG|nr:TadE family protein [Magnetospirillum sp.]
MFGDRRGSAAAEFGILFPVLLTIMLGVVDVGWDAVEAQTARAASQSGANYAIVKGFDAAGIANAVATSTLLTGVTATPAPTNTTSGCASTAGIGACSGKQAAGTYVTVNARASFTPILHWAGTASSFSAATVVRIN